MTVQVVLVHGIRTSASMWRAQTDHLAEAGATATAVDLPGHGRRIGETFSLDEAFATIDRAVVSAAARGPVLLVGHSMGGLLSIEYAAARGAGGVAGLIAASCTAVPRGVGLAAYRMLSGAFYRLPRRGEWFSERVLDRTLPRETRADFGAGGYAYAAQDVALRSLSVLDLLTALGCIDVPLWFVNGEFDQLRTHERLFTRIAPAAELIVVPRTTHLVTAMRPRVFNAVLDVAVATLDRVRSEA